MARQMQDSGVEWIGEIPLDWGTSKMRYIGQYINGYAFKPDDWSSEGKRIIRIQDLTGTNNNPNYYAGQLPDKYNVTAGDILVSWAATLDAFIWNNEDAWLNQHIFKAICFPKVMDKNFFFWVLKEAMENMNNDNKHGIVMQHITLSVFSNFTIPLPPKLVQRRIANYLDRKCAEIDAIIAKQQQIIEKLKEYKLSVITEAVTKGLDPNVPMKDSGVKWIGKIPEHWNILKLQAHTRMLTPMRDRPEKLDGDIPWVRIEDYDGKYISTSKEGLGVSLETVNEMNLKIYPVGSILCTSSCDLGKCAIVTRELVSNQRFINIIPDLDTNSDYLYYLMISNAKRLNHLSTGTIQANLSRKAFEHLMVQFPPFAEQKEIAEYLDKKCETVELSIRKKQELIDRLNLYKKSLIYETVTGKKEI